MMSGGSCWPQFFTLKFLLGIEKLFHLGELIIVVETLGIGERATRRDRLARHNLLDGKLDFLHVDRRLAPQALVSIVPTVREGSHEVGGYSPGSLSSRKYIEEHASC